MKELYCSQLQALLSQSIISLGVGWGLTYPLMGPILRAQAQNFVLRLPAALSFSFFLAVQGANWQRPDKAFHEIVSQPAPHGSYLRRTLKEHFPVWWYNASNQLNENGYSLPEMHSYDKATQMPKSATQFNPNRFWWSWTKFNMRWRSLTMKERNRFTSFNIFMFGLQSTYVFKQNY